MKKPEQPTMKLAILAHCHECCGEYLDGRLDCQNPRCQFYKWFPYKNMEPNFWWLDYNPRRPGRVKWEDCADRKFTEAHKDALRKVLAQRHRTK